ncbi:MAG: endonuclease/exonuclease/phosphatase family protein [Syntrophobacter sp.]
MLTFMTLNLRFDNDQDGDNAWHFRKEIVLDLVRNHSPTILGTQEGTTGQLSYLADSLEDYELLAPGRFWEKDCQYCSLYFRRDEVRPVSGGEFWLSLTPHVHRSGGWDSAYPRMISYGVFQELKNDRIFLAGVTHLDHMGSEARIRQAEIIREFVIRQGSPVVLMGDFNDRPGSAAHKVLTSPDSGMLDTWEALRKPENESSMTYHRFTGTPQVFRMDWILASPHFKVFDARVIHDHAPGARYPSDHFPYLTRLDWA